MDNSKTPVYMRPRIDFSNGHGRDLLGLINKGIDYILFVDQRGDPIEDSIPYAKNILSFDGTTMNAEEVGLISLIAPEGSKQIEIQHAKESRVPISYAPTCFTGAEAYDYLSNALERARQPQPTIEQ